MALPQIDLLLHGFGTAYANGTTTGYLAGTSTLAAWYEDAAGTTPAANPYTLSSTGTATLYCPSRLKIDVKNSVGVSAAGFPVDNLGFGNVVNASWTLATAYGGTKDDATLNDAISALGASTATLYVEPGTWNINENVTLPANITLKVDNGTIFNVASGKTLAINGAFSADLNKIFEGSGAVSFGPSAGVDVFPQWWGAAGDGVTDDTSALSAALNSVSSGGKVFIPAGTYLTTPLVLTDISNVTLYGINKFSSIIRLTSSGTLLTLSNAQWCKIQNIEFAPNSAPHAIANSYGIAFTDGASNNTVDDCAFLGFEKDGLTYVGTVSSQLTGNKTTNCYFLGNANYQMSAYYSQDFHIENNQFGSLTAVAHSAIGCLVSTSHAGLYKGNFHWGNVIGFKHYNCNYNTYSLNRFEESDQQNVYIDGGQINLFSNNKCHTASLSGDGLYDNVHLVNTTLITVSENLVFSWDTTYSRWGIYIGTGCSGISMAKNRVSGYDSTNCGPYRIGAAVGAISCDYEVRGSTGAPTSPNQTTYIGAQLNTFTEALATFQVSRKCQVARMWAGTDAAPGAGQSNTYTVRKNAADTSMTAASTGASSFTAMANSTEPAILIDGDGSIGLKLTTSTTAAAANHRFYISLLEY